MKSWLDSIFNWEHPKPKDFHFGRPACVATLLPQGDQRFMAYQTQIASPILPKNDGVYTQDGSPPIGSYPWKKTNISYCLVLQQGQTFTDIPNTHDLYRSVNAAYTSWELFCGLKFTPVSYTSNPDIAITVTTNDPFFTPPAGQTVSSTMGYTYYPYMAPAGKFVTVLNAQYLWSEDGKFNFSYNINNTLRHELGHSIGCVHTTAASDIMYPFYVNNMQQSLMDQYQVELMYGGRTPPLNPIEVAAFFAGDKNRFP